MLHTSGFPHAPFLATAVGRPRRVGSRASARGGATGSPGPRFEYHPTSAHWVLAELIERASGRDFREYVRTEVLDAARARRGLQVGVPAGRPGRHQRARAHRRAATARGADGGARHPRAAGHRGHAGSAASSFNQPAVRAVGVPGRRRRSRPRPTSRSSTRRCCTTRPGIWKAGRARRTPRPSSATPTRTGSARPPTARSASCSPVTTVGRTCAGWAETVSPGTFGHNGAGGQIAWADPATGLSFVYLTNGLDQHQIRQARRTTALASRAAVCVTAGLSPAAELAHRGR